jgi:hypothetical protein
MPVSGARSSLEQIAQRLIGKFLQILYLAVAEQVRLLPGLFVDLDTFRRHGSPLQLGPHSNRPLLLV